MNITSRDRLCINTIRTLSIDAVQAAQCGHPGTPMAMAPVAFVLWDRFLKHDPSRPDLPNRDRFVLSMGHASALLYSLLHLTGYELSLDELKTFRQSGSRCAGHPESTLIAGVEATTGPLGQGLGNSVGMAIAREWLAARYNKPGFELVDYTVYALCSDGDIMEGVGSEAASLAGHLGLSNLIWIYDDNAITIDGHTDIAFSENVGARFQAYGWLVLHVDDANNLDEIHVALERAKAEVARPTLIIVKSQIGYGSPNRAGTPEAHGAALGENEVRLTKQFYGWDADQNFMVPNDVRRHMTDGARERGQALSHDWDGRLAAFATSNPELAEELRCIQSGQLPVDWDADVPNFAADEKGMATRSAGGKILAALSRRVPWLLGGGADLASSTKTVVPDGGLFSRDNRQGRNLAFGVREHAMAAVMNGLALTGLRPFGSSFLTFSDYCRPAIRLAALSHLPCLFVFTHDSIGLGEDGPTHQPIEHLASLRAMPNLDVVRPCDANETAAAWKYAMATTDRPVLLALTRQDVPVFDRKRMGSADGLTRGAYVLLDCEGVPDVILIGSGSEVQWCVGAAEMLAKEGVGARVVSMPCWERFEREAESYRESILLPTVTARVSIEAGAALGWSRWVGDAGESIGIDVFGKSGPADDLMREYGFSAERVADAARRLIRKVRSSATSAARRNAQKIAGANGKRSEDGAPTGRTRIHEISAVGQSVWCDTISRSMIDSGELKRLVDMGIVGVTSNPTIFQQAVASSTDYDQAIQSQMANGSNDAAVYEALVVRDIVDAADVLRAVYDRTHGRDGYVSLEVNPHLAHDTGATVAEARHLWNRLDRPNVFIKVPATAEGIPAIETLIGQGINVNVTLIFSLNMYGQVMEAYVRGLERLADGGLAAELVRVASVASFFVSRVDTLVDGRLQARIDSGQKELKSLLGRAAVANAKQAYQQYKSVFHGQRFAVMRAKGASVQRPLWASTSTKNPAYSDTIYVDPLIGPETVNTAPPVTISAILDHGSITANIESELDPYTQVLSQIESAGIRMDEVTDELLRAGVKAFADSFDALMSDIRAKMASFQAV